MIFKDEKCIALAYLYHKFGSRNADNISKCETVFPFYISQQFFYSFHICISLPSLASIILCNSNCCCCAIELVQHFISISFDCQCNCQIQLAIACLQRQQLSLQTSCMCVCDLIRCWQNQLVCVRVLHVPHTELGLDIVGTIFQRYERSCQLIIGKKRSIARKTERRGERERQIDEPDMRDNTRDAY